VKKYRLAHVGIFCWDFLDLMHLVKPQERGKSMNLSGAGADELWGLSADYCLSIFYLQKKRIGVLQLNTLAKKLPLKQAMD